ncbi:MULTISPECIES: helix-turn-helix domain-containing protein [unclassified Jeotgalibaca]|uniref:helix-turn-helix domain-containing protein n=1 Tax=unclassified Jeotgalibaca TaxID=2621505 RepID=UPI003FD0E3DA
MVKSTDQTRKTGEILKKIRQNKKYTQQFVTEGIISQSAYSKLERGVIDLTYNKFVKILSRLDVSEYEFQMLLDEEPDPRDALIEEFFLINYNDAAALTTIHQEVNHYLLDKQDYIIEDISYICEALILISKKRDYEQASIFANKVWKRLEKFDRWYMMEIRLINAILFIFPTETALNISERIVQQLKDYQTRESRVLADNIQTNLTLLLIRSGNYSLALENLEELIIRFKQKNNYRLLAIVYIRKGIALRLLHDASWEEDTKKGLKMLDAFEDDNLKKALTTEIEHYKPKNSAN